MPCVLYMNGGPTSYHFTAVTIETEELQGRNGTESDSERASLEARTRSRAATRCPERHRWKNSARHLRNDDELCHILTQRNWEPNNLGPEY